MIGLFIIVSLSLVAAIIALGTKVNELEIEYRNAMCNVRCRLERLEPPFDAGKEIHKIFKEEYQPNRLQKKKRRKK